MVWVFIVIAVVVVAVILMYSGLVQSKKKVEYAWGQIDIQLQRRFDLIPNLVECVKGYMTHEQDTLTKVTELRTSWAKAQTVEEKANLDGQLSGALKTIMAVSENYPDLKANQNFTELQEELRNTENKISYSRQFYNDTVQKYNETIGIFPNNIIANMFGFKEEEFFKVMTDAEKDIIRPMFEGMEEKAIQEYWDGTDAIQREVFIPSCK